MSGAAAAVLPVETRFGVFEAAPADVISMPDGLPGFERCRRFVLLTSPELAPLTCLQGLEDERPSFLAIDPHVVLPGYAGVLAPADRHRLAGPAEDQMLWLALVRLDAGRVFVNMASTIVINPAQMLGLQVIGADSAYSTRHELLVG
jgi:flagellar assembly factor FliW